MTSNDHCLGLKPSKRLNLTRMFKFGILLGSLSVVVCLNLKGNVEAQGNLLSFLKGEGKAKVELKYDENELQTKVDGYIDCIEKEKDDCSTEELLVLYSLYDEGESPTDVVKSVIENWQGKGAEDFDDEMRSELLLLRLDLVAYH
ncbi:unnamed protein product [Cylicocyclus nassatus]|uniref:Uncharacterized protein n=1 Tax=Cylicocyclus nassatus TaxID=53992 RepID=A0AA36DRE1_CYLNA|nr:unnamed protein product [Cylicocyclus nassatus]